MMAGEDCANPIAITSGTYFGTTTGAASNFWFADVNLCQGVSSVGPPSPDLVFSIAVPAGQRLTASLNTAPDGGSAWDSVLNIVDGAPACGVLGSDGGTQGLTCVSGSDNGNPETGTFLNSGNSSKTALLMVKGYFSTSFGLFGLTTNVAAVPPGDLCESATVMDGGVQDGILLSPATAFNDYSGSGTGCAFSSSGPDLTFRTTVPAGQRLSWLAQPDAGLDVSVSLTTSIAECGTRVCVANSNAGTTGVLERATYVNRTASPVDVFAIVDGTSTTSNGFFSLSSVIDSQPMGDVCTTATPLTAGTTLMGETLVNFTNDYAGGTNCSTTFAGLDRTYSFTLPGAQQALVTVTPSTGLNTAISVVDTSVGCGNGVCVAGADNGVSGVADTLAFANPGSQPRTVFIIVDSSSASTPTTFNIGVTATPIPPNDVCELAGAPITASMSVPGTLTGKGNDYNWGSNQGCATGTTSRDAVHAVTIPAGQQLTATVATTAGAWDPTLNIVDGTTCVNTTAQTCLVGAAVNSVTTVGSSEVARFINTGTTPRTVFVVVDTSITTGSDYSLTVDLAAPTQALASIAAACDDLSTGTVTTLLSSATTPAISDDVVSPNAALPFAYSLLGSPVTTYSVSSNGNVQFFATTGAGVSDYVNLAIPTVTVPNGFAAPFWDDLRNVTTTVIRSATFGMAPNRRFTVEWFDSTLSGSVERLRFQAQIYETSNVTEFHYCAINPGSVTDGRANGNSATIGLENLTGASGVQAGFNRPNSAVTGGAVRFTP